MLLQGDLGLNIREAHVFNTTDGFALDVFVVDGWNNDVSREQLLISHLAWFRTMGTARVCTATNDASW